MDSERVDDLTIKRAMILLVKKSENNLGYNLIWIVCLILFNVAKNNSNLR